MRDTTRPAWLLDLPERAILYRDAALVVVDKPAGVPCQSPDASQPEDVPSLLIRRLARDLGVPETEVYLGTHQRLDQDTSGVLLYSLDRQVNTALAEQFQTRAIDKHYVAAVSGKPPRPGSVLEHWLVPGGSGTMRVGRADEPGAKRARTRVLAVETCGQRSLLTLAIDTGRTHQIRVQLAAVGCAVAGDDTYGGAPALRLLLHSQLLGFVHPVTGEALQISAAVPLELRAWLNAGAQPVRIFDDPALLRRGLELAAARRVSLLRSYEAGTTTVFRWLNGAADGFDDVYLDVYDRWLSLRVDGDERSSDEQALIAALRDLGFQGAYVKRHPRQANELVDPNAEDLAPRTPVFGSAAPDSFLVHERAVPLEVQLTSGLRTGLFLDQRDNRALVASLASERPGELRVLNLFGYTGSFSVMALAAGATCVTVDVSRAALTWAERNVARVGASDRHRVIAEDAFVALRSMQTRGEQFDCVILDPPSYSTTKHGRFRVVKDYPELCAATLRLVAPGGVLIACVNHHGVSYATLRRFVQKAAGAAGCGLDSLREQPAQRDFPVVRGAAPAMKSIIVRVSQRIGMRSASAGTSPRKWSR
ncbi:MAG: hypothetical protein RL701_6472 [Pseudomonadota bacterium]|jgi:23S rRNA (cytosine1962-C5)-methyltransferase